MTRSNENLTSSAVIGLPLANLTFGRNLNRHDFPSADRSQLVASSGLRLTYSPGAIVTSVSYAAFKVSGGEYCAMRAGSNVIVSLMSSPITIVFLGCAASGDASAAAAAIPTPSA